MGGEWGLGCGVDITHSGHLKALATGVKSHYSCSAQQPSTLFIKPAFCLIFLSFFSGDTEKHCNFVILYSASILGDFRTYPNSQ